MASTSQLADSCVWDGTNLTNGGVVVTPDTDTTGATGSVSLQGHVLLMVFDLTDQTVTKTVVTVTGLSPSGGGDFECQVSSAVSCQYGAIDSNSKLLIPAGQPFAWSTSPNAQLRARVWLSKSA